MRKPRTVVSIIRSLWEKGYFYTPKNNKKISASSNLLNYSSERNGMPIADYIFSAVLRDNANLIFKIDPTEKSTLEINIEGITFPWQMQGFMKELFSYKDSNVKGDWTVFGGDLEALKDAGKNTTKTGGISFILVDYDGIKKGTPSYAVAVPTHWMAIYDNSVSYDSKTGHVKFKAFTYGKIYEFNLKWTDFTNFTYWIGTGHA
jgi:hypothetical protein